MEFFILLIFLFFILYISMYGTKKPILNLIYAIVILFVAAASFTSKGHDWVNTFWGVIAFIVAIFYADQYKKYRR